MGKKNKFKGVIVFMKKVLLTIVCFLALLTSEPLHPTWVLPIGHTDIVNHAGFSQDNKQDDKWVVITQNDSILLLRQCKGKIIFEKSWSNYV